MDVSLFPEGRKERGRKTAEKGLSAEKEKEADEELRPY